MADEFKGNVLPDFPVDDTTLDLLWEAMHPDPAIHDRTHVGEFLDMMARLGGSDPRAVAEQIDENTFYMRDQTYMEMSTMTSMITEIRRLRAGLRLAKRHLTGIHDDGRMAAAARTVLSGLVPDD